MLILGLQSENKAELLVKNDAEILENIERSSGFLRDSTMFINIYRTKILKNSVLFSVNECPYGFGYYSANNDCSKYKICKNKRSISSRRNIESQIEKI